MIEPELKIAIILDNPKDYQYEYKYKLVYVFGISETDAIEVMKKHPLKDIGGGVFRVDITWVLKKK